MNNPIRSGKWDILGANCECNFPAVSGVAKSIINPIIYNPVRISNVVTKAEVNQIKAAIEKPIIYLFSKGLGDSGVLIILLL